MTQPRRLLQPKPHRLPALTKTVDEINTGMAHSVDYRKLMHTRKHSRDDCLRLLDRTRPFFNSGRQSRHIEYDFDSSDLNSEFRKQTAVYNNMMYKLNNDPSFLVRVKGSMAAAGSPAIQGSTKILDSANSAESVEQTKPTLKRHARNIMVN